MMYSKWQMRGESFHVRGFVQTMGFPAIGAALCTMGRIQLLFLFS